MEDIFMRKSYDISFKQLVIEEYFTNHLGYKKIANKYGIARDTVRNWVLKYKKEANSNEVSLAAKSSNFVEVTDKIYSIPAHQVEKEELVTLFVNGFSISTDAKGIKAMMEALAK